MTEDALPRLSDEEAMAQVVEPARQIVLVAGLRDVSGGFSFESCNDQGDPPYRGRVEMSFAMPADIEPDAYFHRIAAVMVTQGWIDGPPPGRRPLGVVIHTETVMAMISRASAADMRGSVPLGGQCRNMADHRNDGQTVGVEITGQLTDS